MGMAWPFGLVADEKVCLGRVLVVDDEDSIRSLLRMTLAQAGYDVEEAEDGGRAVEVLNSGDNPLMVDVIICDIRMPRINGVEAIAYFRAVKGHPNVLSSGHRKFPTRITSSSRRPFARAPLSASP